MTVPKPSEWLDRLSAAPRVEEITDMWEWIAEVHGPIAWMLEEIVVSRVFGDYSADLYAMKNDELQLSLDMGIGYSRALYEAQLDQLLRVMEELPAPRRVLDPGCENGLLTCFYALLWPEAQIIGVDSSPQAIACAAELREREGIDNVEFFICDEAGADIRGLGLFDLILASRTFIFEGVGVSGLEPDLTQPTLEPMPPREAPLGWGYLSAAVGALAPEGTLLSLERCGEPSVFPSWLSGLSSLDLAIQWDASSWLEFDEAGTPRAEPMLALSRPSRPEPWDSVIAFLLMRPGSASWPEYLWSTVEEKIGPGTLVCGVELIPMDGGATQAITLERTPSHVVSRFAADGVRQTLETFPSGMEYLALDEFEMAVEQARDMGAVRTF